MLVVLAGVAVICGGTARPGLQRLDAQGELQAAARRGDPAVRTPPLQLSAQDELHAARTAERSGRYDEAVIHYERFLAGADASHSSRAVLTQVRTRLAKAYFLLHRYQESLQALPSLPSGAKGPASRELAAQAWLVEGLDYLELEQLPEAITFLGRALAADPESGTARLALGDALARSGRLQEAARQYQNQLRRTPALADGWYKLGLAYAQLARRTLDAFVQGHPENALGQQLAAEELLAKGDYWGAARKLLPLRRGVAPGFSPASAVLKGDSKSQPNVALKDGARLPGLHADLGTALIQLGYQQTAEHEFRQELSADSESPPALLGLAETEALRGDWNGAFSNFERLAQSHPLELRRRLELPAPALLRQAWATRQAAFPVHLASSPAAHLWDLWLRDSDSGILAIPTDSSGGARPCTPGPAATRTPGLWFSEACYARLAAQLKARKGLDLADRIKLAEAEFRLGRYKAARAEAQRALESSSDNGWGPYWLTKSYEALADECFAKVSSLNPDSARVHQMLARHYADQYNLKRAAAEYEAAIRLAPDLPDLHLGLGTLYWQAGDWRRAESELQKALELSPSSTVAHYELGDAYVAEHRWEWAIPCLRRAVADPSLLLKARLDLAKAEAGLGQTQKAVEDLLSAAQYDRDGELHYRLAVLYRKLGETTKAQTALDTSERLRAASLQVDRSEVEALEKERLALEQFERAH